MTFDIIRAGNTQAVFTTIDEIGVFGRGLIERVHSRRCKKPDSIGTIITNFK